ncbi:hypothetical protein [Pleionea mediterranea]|uniref:Uncharacterized protein n=1 Tax=Pleionea mediterranea TaxID=523701 RepID=A0A316G0B0_9GAMM|nr:hypothetical protein [Pleionea mediterranea]PWK54341.1 hypothetical protein C8D97_101189 [Pleionea mediterranea]
MVIKPSNFKKLKYYYNIYDKFGGILLAIILLPISIWLYFLYFSGALNLPELKKYVGKASIVRCIEYSSYSSVYFKISGEQRVNAKINHINCKQAKELYRSNKIYEITYGSSGSIFGLHVDKQEILNIDEEKKEHVVTAYGILCLATIWLILSFLIIRNNTKYITEKKKSKENNVEK